MQTGKKKVKLSLSMPRQHIGEAEVQLQSFLTSVPRYTLVVITTQLL